MAATACCSQRAASGAAASSSPAAARSARGTRPRPARRARGRALARAAEGRGEPGDFSIMTFNVLCPEYKRVSGSDGGRESAVRESYMRRTQALIEHVCARPASIICLQEVWLGNDEVGAMWRRALAERGFDVRATRRTSCRCDGLMTAIDEEVFEVVESRDCLFNDCGDRVATALRLRRRRGPPGGGDELILVNTHLLFPHNASSTAIRLREAFKVRSR